MLKCLVYRFMYMLYCCIILAWSKCMYSIPGYHLAVSRFLQALPESFVDMRGRDCPKFLTSSLSVYEPGAAVTENQMDKVSLLIEIFILISPPSNQKQFFQCFIYFTLLIVFHSLTDVGCPHTPGFSYCLSQVVLELRR